MALSCCFHSVCCAQAEHQTALQIDISVKSIINHIMYSENDADLIVAPGPQVTPLEGL